MESGALFHSRRFLHWRLDFEVRPLDFWQLASARLGEDPHIVPIELEILDSV